MESERPSPPTSARALHGKPLRHDVAVDQRRRRGRLQPAIGGAHAPQRRLQNIVAVDAADLTDDDRHAGRSHDLGVTILARLRGENLRVVQAFRDAVRIEDHGCDHHRPSPGPAAGLVDADDWPVQCVHQLRFEIEGRNRTDACVPPRDSHGDEVLPRGLALATEVVAAVENLVVFRSRHFLSFVMAGLVPAIHDFAHPSKKRGCPAQGRA